MAYNKHEWSNGELITSQLLNNVELGVANAEEKSPEYGSKALVSSFSGNNISSLDLYTTRDFETFSPINKTVLGGLENEVIRDPSLIYVNGVYYVAYTWGYAKSYDLITWEKGEIGSSGLNANTLWAPEFFTDNLGNNYLFCSSGPDKDNISIYFSIISDFDNLKSISWQKLDFPDPNSHTNHIDPFIFYYGEYYYLLVKDETTGEKNIQLYKSSSPTSGYSFVMTLPFSQPVEGPSAIVDNGTIYLFADDFNNGVSYSITTKDLQSFSSQKMILSSDGSRMQHFSIKLVDFDENDIIQKATRHFVTEQFSNSKSTTVMTNPRVQLASGNVTIYPENAINTTYILPETVTGDSTVTIKMDKVYHLTKIYFLNKSRNFKIKILNGDGFSIGVNRTVNNNFNYFGLWNTDVLVELTSLGSLNWSGVNASPFIVSNGVLNDTGPIKSTLFSDNLDTTKSNNLFFRRIGHQTTMSASIFLSSSNLSAGIYQIGTLPPSQDIGTLSWKQITGTSASTSTTPPVFQFNNNNVYLQLRSSLPSVSEVSYDGVIYNGDY